jgi:hypothetical protein
MLLVGLMIACGAMVEVSANANMMMMMPMRTACVHHKQS